MRAIRILPALLGAALTLMTSMPLLAYKPLALDTTTIKTMRDAFDAVGESMTLVSQPMLDVFQKLSHLRRISGGFAGMLINGAVAGEAFLKLCENGQVDLLLAHLECTKKKDAVLRAESQADQVEKVVDPYACSSKKLNCVSTKACWGNLVINLPLLLDPLVDQMIGRRVSKDGVKKSVYEAGFVMNAIEFMAAGMEIVLQTAPAKALKNFEKIEWLFNSVEKMLKDARKAVPYLADVAKVSLQAFKPVGMVIGGKDLATQMKVPMLPEDKQWLTKPELSITQGDENDVLAAMSDLDAAKFTESEERAEVAEAIESEELEKETAGSAVQSQVHKPFEKLVSPAQWSALSLEERLDQLSSIGGAENLRTKREKRIFNRRLFTTAVLMIAQTLRESFETAVKRRSNLPGTVQFPASWPELSNLLVAVGFLIRDTLVNEKYLQRLLQISDKVKCISRRVGACKTAKCIDEFDCLGLLMADIVAFFEPWVRSSLDGFTVQIEGKKRFFPGILPTVGTVFAPDSKFHLVSESMAKVTHSAFVIMKKSHKAIRKLSQSSKSSRSAV